MIATLYKHRFAIFFVIQLLTLFGSLVFPTAIFETIALPVLLQLNLIGGILLISKNKKLMWFIITLLVISILALGVSLFQRSTTENLSVRLAVYFVFYAVVTFQIIKQVWQSKTVDSTVIIGVMSGYISLGLIAFFLLMGVELHNPGSFSGVLLESNDFTLRADAIIYYSYITLMTIGYGEIIPVTPVAQKIAIFTGLMGQFYLVIITAIVVGKYIQHSDR